MKALLVLLSLAAVSNALIDDTGEDCIGNFLVYHLILKIEF